MNKTHALMRFIRAGAKTALIVVAFFSYFTFSLGVPFLCITLGLTLSLPGVVIGGFGYLLFKRIPSIQRIIRPLAAFVSAGLAVLVIWLIALMLQPKSDGRYHITLSSILLSFWPVTAIIGATFGSGVGQHNRQN